MFHRNQLPLVPPSLFVWLGFIYHMVDFFRKKINSPFRSLTLCQTKAINSHRDCSNRIQNLLTTYNLLSLQMWQNNNITRTRIKKYRPTDCFFAIVNGMPMHPKQRERLFLNHSLWFRKRQKVHPFRDHDMRPKDLYYLLLNLKHVSFLCFTSSSIFICSTNFLFYWNLLFHTMAKIYRAVFTK